MKRLLLVIVLMICNTVSYAITWDEPWQKEIIEKADFFVFGKVVQASDSIVSIEVKKSFGKNIDGTIQLDNFFLLDICSASGGHGPEFSFEEGEEAYFFLKKGENGNYQIPTPSSGFDRIVDGKVHATYRHSYHQAAMSIEVYEFTYQAIWSKYHSGTYNHEEIIRFINDNLQYAPAGFEEDEIALFFNQHAALETAYLLGIEIDFNILKKFSDSDNFHARVSAIRAMYYLNNEMCKTYLLRYLQDDDKDDFTKVIAIWSLWKMKDRKIKKALWEIKDQLSDEESGFGGNIMDPRICTHFPSPREAIFELKEYKQLRKKIQLK